MVNKLLERLTKQVGGNKKMAAAILNKRGDMKGDKLTKHGEERQALGAAGRAKDRAAKTQGGKPSDYTYNQMTNAARKRK